MLGLSGCYGEQDVALPLPQELTRAAIGHYCGMIVADHVGPKAQIFVKGSKTPVWFASVRDAFTFMTLPGEAKNISAVYVNDMGGSANWKSPEAGTWIDARKAYFVLNSNRKGGMGLKETVPFSTSEAAATFATRHGGHVISFSKVPSDYVLGDDSMPVNDGPHIGHHGKMKKGGES
jgi:copper chaperone NosL